MESQELNPQNKEFYYQIKGKKGIAPDAYNFGNWSFPPIYSGKVSAIDKKQAKIIIEDKYNKSFPLRVLAKDLDSNEFLLSIDEITANSRYISLFEERICKQCDKPFRIIDKYNDSNCQNKGSEFCSAECAKQNNEIQRFIRLDAENLNGFQKSTREAIIYKITNKKTNQIYIGKTTQIFTLRWYQHFFQYGNNKFHNAIKESKPTDWIFEVQEVVEIPPTVKTMEEINELIIQRERYYIELYDCINCGYNSKN